MQMFAPWVHAHVGEETGGLFHVPGLERVMGVGDDRPGASGAGDLIVSLPTGIEQHDNRQQAPDDGRLAADVPPPLRLPALRSLAAPASPVATATSIPQPDLHSGAPPRASPAD